MNKFETISEIVAAHRAGTSTPAQTIARCYQRIRAYADPALFITLRDEADAVAEAVALAARDPSLPLYGVPVAVKDNIDVAGLPTTAACPAFSYQPACDATAVAKLRAAGAIVIGKTNLDQFATGLVGVRSPYGVPRNAIRSDLVPGGSSSGSAVAVGAGLVPLSLGTDTAGSGRVPAMLNNIVGLKPSLGMISTAGVVPACRTLDCVSVFALTTDDALTALRVMAAPDAEDPFSRDRPVAAVSAMPSRVRLGVPQKGQLQFFGDDLSARGYEDALDHWRRLGAELVEIDVEPLYETARLLYEGPWVAERYLTIRELLETQPDAVHPVTRQITLAGAKLSAADTFAALYRLQALRKHAERSFTGIDALVLPTAPTAYTVEEVQADPITLNSRLGTYTNFVNLLDLCGLAVPASIRNDGIPFGITLLAPAGRDAELASLGRVFHADTALPMGAGDRAQPPLAAITAGDASDEIAIAVVGAHLSGMPLNHELTTRGGRLLSVTATVPDYKLYALKGTTPPKPGLLRVAPGAGAAIALEVWALSPAAFGTFVAAIPSPLSIGTLTLADGAKVKGFLAEPEALAGARDISHFGGWRAYMAELAATG
ncbi:allophanate hydrolase [Rhodopseudomonas sp. WA056]|uniref:allophanate hydrolase n=1 Tax=Rhodopseudomonas sp. WA056 TaxID=2269367 RepID=UPI0013DF860B|nr:allophanate hydrolase [Rhodopseudomonas sp. WA056]NEW88206.1 allophanate hydrolase [Rhodopseudomonas sp. WA056]